MTIWEVTGPDGQVYEVDGPDGSTEADAIAYIQNNPPQEAPLEREPEESTFGEDVVEFGKAIPRGALQTVGSAVEGVGALGAVAGEGFDKLFGTDIFDPPAENELVKAGRSFSALIGESFIGADPRFAGNAANMYGAGIGSIAPFLIPGLGQVGLAARGAGVAGKNAALMAATAAAAKRSLLTRGLATDIALLRRGVGIEKAAGVVGMARYPLAIGVGAGEQSRRLQAARDAGIEVTPGTEAASIIIGGAIGITELAAPDHAVQKLLGLAPPGTGISILQRIGRALATAGIEGVQEAIAGISQDLVEQKLYNPNRKIGESAADEFKVGGVAGGLLQLALDMAIPGRVRTPPKPPPAPRKPTAPPDEEGPEGALPPPDRSDASAYVNLRDAHPRALSGDTLAMLDVRIAATEGVEAYKAAQAEQIVTDAAEQAARGKTSAQAEPKPKAQLAEEVTPDEAVKQTKSALEAAEAKQAEAKKALDKQSQKGHLPSLTPFFEAHDAAEAATQEAATAHEDALRDAVSISDLANRAETEALARAGQEALMVVTVPLDELSGKTAGAVRVRLINTGINEKESYTLGELKELGVPDGQVQLLAEERKPLTEGPSVTAADVINLAQSKNIITDSPNFKAFVKQATGATNMKRMGRARLQILHDAVSLLPESGTSVHMPIAVPPVHTFEQFVAAEQAAIDLGRTNQSEVRKATGLKKPEDVKAVLAEMERNGLTEKMGNGQYKTLIGRRIPDVPVPPAEPEPKFEGETEREYIVESTPSGTHAVVLKAKGPTGPDGNIDLVGQRVISTHDSTEEAEVAAETMRDQEQILPDQQLRAAAEEVTRRDTAEIKRKAQVAAAKPLSETGSARLEEVTKVAEKQMNQRGNVMPLQFVQDIRDYLNKTTLGTLDPRSPAGPGGVVTGDADAIARTLLIAMDVIDEKGMTDTQAAEYVAQIIDHETIHYLIQAGVISDKQWDTLFKFVDKTVRKSNKQGMTYLQEAVLQYAPLAEAEAEKDGLEGAEYDDYVKAYVSEEAMAEAFRDWASDRRLVTGKPVSIFRRIGRFFKQLANVLRRSGVQSIEDIFGGIESGEAARGADIGEGGITKLARHRMQAVDRVIEKDDMALLQPLPLGAPLNITATGGKAGNTITLLDIGRSMDDNHREVYGRPLDPADKEDYAMILHNLSAAYDEQMGREGAPEEWYIEDVERAIKTTKKIHPELSKPLNQDLFLTMTAFLSPQTYADANWVQGTEAFGMFLDNGKIPIIKTNGKNWGLPAQRQAMGLLQYLVDDMTLPGAMEWLKTPHTGREMAEIRRDSGAYAVAKSLSGNMPDEMRVDEVTMGAYMFGPKVGDFFMNVTGIDQDAVTVDIWIARQYNRLIGRILDTKDSLKGKEIQSDVRNRGERDHIKNLIRDLAGMKGIQPSAAQAVLWYYEQRLFDGYGVKSKSTTFSEGADQAFAKFGSSVKGTGQGANNLGKDAGKAVQGTKLSLDEGKLQTVYMVRVRRGGGKKAISRPLFATSDQDAWAKAQRSPNIMRDAVEILDITERFPAGAIKPRMSVGDIGKMTSTERIDLVRGSGIMRFFGGAKVDGQLEEVMREKSRATLVFMPPEMFTDLATSGLRNPGQEKVFAENMDRGMALNSIPSLAIEGGLDGKTANVISHEGRHRAAAFTINGHNLMPVILTHRTYRWGDAEENARFSTTRPTHLIPQGHRVPEGAYQGTIRMPDSVAFPENGSEAQIADVMEADYLDNLTQIHAGLAFEPSKLEQAARDIQPTLASQALQSADFERIAAPLTSDATLLMSGAFVEVANANGAERVHSSAALGMFGGSKEVAVTFDAVFPEDTGMDGVNATAAEVMMSAKENNQEEAFVAMRVPLDYEGDNVRHGLVIFFYPQAFGGRTEMDADHLQSILDDLATDNVQGFTAFQSDTATTIEGGYEGIRFMWVPEYTGVTAEGMEENRLAVLDDFATIAQRADERGIGSAQAQNFIAALGSEGTYDEIANELLAPVNEGDAGTLGEHGPWRQSVRSSLETRARRGKDQPREGPGDSDADNEPNFAPKLALAYWENRLSTSEFREASTLILSHGAVSHGTFWQNNSIPIPIVLMRGHDEDGFGFGREHFNKHANDFGGDINMMNTLEKVMKALSGRTKDVRVIFNEKEASKYPMYGPFFDVIYTDPKTKEKAQLGIEVLKDKREYGKRIEGQRTATMANFYPILRGVKQYESRKKQASAGQEDIAAYRAQQQELRDERAVRTAPLTENQKKTQRLKTLRLKAKASLGPYQSTGNRVRHYTPDEGLVGELDAISDRSRRILGVAAKEPYQQQGFIARGIGRVLRDPKFIDLRIVLQDKMLPVERLIEMISDAGGSITDATNTYMREQLYHGKTMEEVRERETALYNPLLNEIKSSKNVKLADLEDYLVALHAEERNDEINRRRKEGDAPLTDKGSGITTAKANKILAAFTSEGKTAELQRLAGMVRAIIADTNKTRLEGGLISQAMIDASPYRNYVPLKGGEEEDFEHNPDHPLYSKAKDNKLFMRTGSGGIRGKEDKSPTGRRTPATDIIAAVLIQNEEAVIRSERNAVIKSFGDMVRANSDINITDDQGQKRDISEYAEILDKAPLVLRSSVNGVIKLIPDTRYAGADDVISFKEINPDTGEVEQVNVQIKDPRLVTAMKGAVTPETLNGVIRFMGGFNRWLASVNTAWNPEFIVSNLLKDVQTGGIVAAQYDIDGLSKEIIRPGNIAKSLKAIESVLRAERAIKTPGVADSAYVAAFREMQKHGGTTEFLGIRDMDSLLQDIQDKVGDIGDATTWQKSKKAAVQLANFIGDYNKVAENAVRLQLYKSLRDRGVTPAQAAFAAKNLTVNFNKGGTHKTLANSLFLFYNASLQGSWVLVNSLRSKRVQKIVAGVVVAGMVSDFVNYLMAGDHDDDERNDWDEVDDWQKERNFFLMNPTGGPHLKVPMPYGFNAFFNLGRAISATTRPGGLKAWDAASSVAMTFLDSFNPIGGTNSLANFVAPTLLDPIVDLYGNEDFAGRAIKPPRMNGLGVAADPSSQVYYNNTAPPAIYAADFINKLTGGGTVRPGLMDFSPNQIEYVFDYALGGLGTFVMRSAFETPGNIYKAMEGDWENVELNDIVFARKIIGSVGNTQDRRQFYDNAQDVTLARKEFDHYVKTGNSAGIKAAMKKFGGQIQLSSVFKSIISQLSNRRKRLKAVRDNVHIKEGAREKIEDQIKEEMDILIDQANRLYNTRIRR